MEDIRTLIQYTVTGTKYTNVRAGIKLPRTHYTRPEKPRVLILSFSKYVLYMSLKKKQAKK